MIFFLCAYFRKNKQFFFKSLHGEWTEGPNFEIELNYIGYS